MDFRRKLPRTCAELHLDVGQLNFRDLTTLIGGWMEAHGLRFPGSE